MMGGYFAEAGVFLIQFIFGLYILAVLLRFMLQLVRADFYNPISQFLVSLTNPPLRPLRRLIPGLWGIDLASVLLLLVLSTIQWLLIYLLTTGTYPNLLGLLVYSLADLLKLTLYVYYGALFIRIIVSWINPYARQNPALNLVARLTEPLMRPARRLLPATGGIDFSPLLVFLALGLAQILILQPLLLLGQGLMR
jgi:YggT family protein